MVLAIPATLALTLLRLLPLRLHPQPHHALRADLLHRHPGGRRHRGGREHRPPLPPARSNTGAPRSADRRRGGGRGGQPDHPGHLRGDRRHPADGLRGRPDGPVHAAHPDRAPARPCSFRCSSPSSSPPGPPSASCAGAGRSRPADGDAAAASRPTSRGPREPGRLLHPALPPRHGPAARPRPLALGLPGRDRRCCSLAAMALVGLGSVKVKMLPFDNKSEFQVILNMPEGTPAGADRPGGRARWPRRRARRARGDRLPGLRRHGRALQLQRPGAPLLPAPRPDTWPTSRSTCVPKGERKAQSHDIAKRVRPRVAAIAAKYGAARGRGRGAARPAGAADPGGRGLRPERGEPAARWPRKVRDIFRDTDGRGGHRLVHRDRPAPRLRVPGRQGEGRPARHHRGGASPQTVAAGRRRRRGRPAAPAARAGGRPIVVLQLPQAQRAPAGGPARRSRVRRSTNPAGAARAAARAGARSSDRPVDQSIYHKNLHAGDLRHRRRGRRGREPGLRHPADEQGAGRSSTPANSAAAARRSRSTTLRQPFTDDRAGDEVGRRVAHHPRGLPRPRPGLRRRAGADLHADGRLVPALPHAAGRDGGHPVLAHRHPARRTGCWAPSSPPPR